MKTPVLPSIIGISILAVLLFDPVYADPVAEQSEAFFTHGVAAEKAGDDLVAKNCYQLALRAQPTHKGAADALDTLMRKEAETKLTKGSEAEGKGDFASANLLYLEALRLAPNHPEAEKKTNTLRKKMGASFREGGEVFVEAKLRNTIIPTINFEDTSFEQAIDFLRIRARELDVAEFDPANMGINFVIPKGSGGSDIRNLRIRELRLSNATLNVILKYICDQTKLRYTVADNAVTFLPVNASPPDTKQNPVPAVPTNPANPKWTNKTGKSILGDFVGLDGQAVVIRKEGKEVTIPFASLSPESLAQAKRFGEPPPGVLLYYNFSDASGDKVQDRSGNGRDGTLIGFSDTSAGAGESVQPSGWTKSGSLNFDGVDDYVSTPLSASEFADGSFTIEAVVSHHNVNFTWSPIVGSDARTFDSPGVVQFGKVDTNQYDSPSSAAMYRLNGLSTPVKLLTRPTSIADGNLHHVALVRDATAGEIRVYFDHHLQEVISGVTGTLNGNPNIVIGANTWAVTERWFGVISELRITKAALTLARFLPNPNPTGSMPPPPVHRYSFSGDVKDTIGTAHGIVVDAGQPTARLLENVLDISENKGEASGSPKEAAYAELPDAIIAGMKGEITFELWCQPTDWIFDSSIFEFKGEGITAGLNHRDGGNDLVGIVGAGSTWVTSSSKMDLRPGSEHHFVFVLEGDKNTQTLYLDGYKLAAGKLPSFFPKTCPTGKILLGNRGAGGRMFSGIYNEFRIYDMALSPQEIIGSYLAGPDAKFPTKTKPK